jgi:histone acetyltransferase 1
MPNNQGLKADNVNVITEFFPDGYYTNLDEFLNVMEKKAKTFEPVGEMVEEFKTDDGRTFQIYLCESSTANFQQYHARLESFIFWFIAVSSRIDHDERWRFFVVYEKFETSEGETRYASAGYASVYLYFHYPDKVRPRVSHFNDMVFAQDWSISRHKKTFVTLQLKTPVKISSDFTTPLTLECSNLPTFAAESLKKSFSTEMAQEAKDKFKINPKQSRIIYEILRLGVTKTNNKAEYKVYRIDVKKRLNMNYLKEKRDMKKNWPTRNWRCHQSRETVNS